MDKIKKSFIVVLVLALMVSYIPINARAESSTQSYFNIRKIMKKKQAEINDKDELKIKLLSEDIDASRISIKTTNLGVVEKYFKIADNQILINEAFMNDSQLTETDKTVVLRLVLETNDELTNDNVIVNEDYQIINKNNHPATRIFGGNINKTLKYWWGNRIYRNKKKTEAAVNKYKSLMKKVGVPQALLRALSVYGSPPATITVNLIIDLGNYFANDFIDNLAKNNKGKYGTKLDLPKWFVGYGIYKQTSKTK